MISTVIEGSSAITRVDYDEQAGIMAIVAKTGKSYPYQGIPPEAHAAFLQAESKGKAWGEIRKKYKLASSARTPAPQTVASPAIPEAPAIVASAIAETIKISTEVASVGNPLLAPEELEKRQWRIVEHQPSDNPTIICRKCGRLFRLTDGEHVCVKENLIYQGRW